MKKILGLGAILRRRWFVGLVLLPLVILTFWLSITTWAPASWVASWAPCPRNWGWGPAWLPRASPLQSTAFTVGSASAKVCYGSPSLRGREMLGGRVEFGDLWRSGANEPTSLHLSAAVDLGPLELLPGAYSIYTVPQAEVWEVVVNREIDQWGIESLYPTPGEIGRFEVTPEWIDESVDSLTFSFESQSRESGTLNLRWQQTHLAIPISAVSDLSGR